MVSEIRFKEAELPTTGISQRTFNDVIVTDNVEDQFVSIARSVVRQGWAVCCGTVSE
jgi:hypothetical protein